MPVSRGFPSSGWRSHHSLSRAGSRRGLFGGNQGWGVAAPATVSIPPAPGLLVKALGAGEGAAKRLVDVPSSAYSRGLAIMFFMSETKSLLKNPPLFLWLLANRTVQR